MITRLSLASLLLTSTCLGGFESRNVKVVEWGWGTPPPLTAKANISSMQSTAFDGLVLDLQKNPPLNGDTSDYFSWNAFGGQTLSPANYSQSIDAIKTTSFGRMGSGFLRYNVTPGNLDWFQNLNAAINNAGTAAGAAKDAGFEGILLDVEQYQGQVFNYQQQIQKNQHSFAEYQSQVRSRAGELMTAVKQAFPKAKIMLTFGYELAPVSNVQRETSANGLLPSFVDGLLDQAGPDNMIVNGGEFAYGYTSSQGYEQAYETIRTTHANATANLAKYQSNYRASYGVWLDYLRLTYGWNNSNPNANHITPEKFRFAVQEGVKRSDGYVWVYSEQPNWWDGTMPAAYTDALAKVRREGQLERFTGTSKDTATWTQRTQGNQAIITQDGRLVFDTLTSSTIGQADYTAKSIPISIGDVVSVEVTNLTATSNIGTRQSALAGLVLSNDSGGTNARVLNDTEALMVFWSNFDNSIFAQVNDAGQPDHRVSISGADQPNGATFLYEIERVSSTSALFRVVDTATGIGVGSPVTLTFNSSNEDLYLSLVAESADMAFDNVWIAQVIPEPGLVSIAMIWMAISSLRIVK